MNFLKISCLCLLLLFGKYSNAQRDSEVSVEYKNWLRDAPGKTWTYMYNRYKETYKDSLRLDSCYSFFALIPLKDGFVVTDSVRFIEVPGFPVPDILKKRAMEVIQWTNGQWVGPSKKVALQFDYVRQGAAFDEISRVGIASFSYGLKVKIEDRKSDEIYQMDTNSISIVSLW